MDDLEKQKAYRFIADQNQLNCPGLTVERVKEIHQGLIQGAVKGSLNEEACIEYVIEDLRAQGLGTLD